MYDLDLKITNVNWCHPPSDIITPKSARNGVLSVAPKLYEMKSLCGSLRAIFVKEHSSENALFGRYET